MAPPVSVGMKVYWAWPTSRAAALLLRTRWRKRERARAADGEPAHVGDVEQAGVAAGGEMLRDHAGGVHERHLPAGEVHHLGAEGDVTRSRQASS